MAQRLKVNTSKMKQTSQALLLSLALWSGTVSANHSYNEKVIEAWSKSNSTTRSRCPQLASDGSTKRLENIPLKGSETVTVLQEVNGTDDGDRRRGLQQESSQVPWPADGAELPKNGNAIHFREDTSMRDIDCFVFKHIDPDKSFSVCEENGVTIPVVDGIAEIQMTGFQLGEYEWWVEDSSGAQSESQKFTIVPPREVVRRSKRTQEVVEEAEWEYRGNIQGSTGRIYYSSYGVDFACTGTVIKDRMSGRTLIVTAAHCVWDDIDEVFGR